MGNPLYKLKCKKCSYEEHIYCGFTYDGNFMSPYYCSNCKKFKYIVFKNDSHINPKPQICDICNSRLDELHIETDKDSDFHIGPRVVSPQVHCPKCKSENIEISFCGLWD